MDGWTPKVGDKVMVGEHGPYSVVMLSDKGDAVMLDFGFTPQEGGPRNYWTRPEWLTPAPEPEPDEPTAPGALVRDGQGRLLFHSRFMNQGRWYEVEAPGGGYWIWSEVPRPVTVILADPAEVEELREKVAEGQRLVEEMAPVLIERDALRAEVESLRAARDSSASDAEGITEDLYRARRQRDRFEAERDELQDRIDRTLALKPSNTRDMVDTFYQQGRILRGES
jgi:hypothetical protein